MRKSIFIFIVLLILSLIASILGMIFVRKPSNINQCTNEGICTLIGYPPRLGFPISVNEGQFDPMIAFIVNMAFYFLVFLGIYFGYLMLTRKRKKK